MNKEPSNRPSPDPDRWAELARYIAGESAPEEAAAIEQWLAADPQRRQLVRSLDQSLQRLAAGEPAEVDVEAALQNVKARFAEAQVRELRSRKTAAAEQFNRGWSTTLIRLAAAVVVLLGVSVVWRATQRNATPPAIAAAQEYTTTVGQTDSLRLADGTRVVLAPGSRLTVVAGYGERARMVELNGEAWFDVQHDAERAFSVRAGAATIRDLGTAFVVRNIAGDNVRVVVTTGSVVLHAASRDEGEGVVLRAGDRGVLDRTGNVTAERGGATSDDVAFTSGRLVFDDATLEEVAGQLRRWYGIELRLHDREFAKRHITAAFDGESAEEALKVIGVHNATGSSLLGN